MRMAMVCEKTIAEIEAALNDWAKVTNDWVKKVDHE